ncbi:DUF4349 domain-containing protein [Saccharothrix sp. HUAS TT1]|uniref:DUF4349 domain-containing protein n=1 Tax=unclassified Saccharothrix TaxID=2593673 RepID=UPI00345C57A6
MGRRVGLALAAFAVLALAGCSAGSSSDSAAGQPAVAPERAQPGGTPKQEAADQGQAQQAGTSAQQDRLLVRTATIELGAADAAAVLGRVKDLVIAEGGYSAQEKSQPHRASVTFKVPGDRLDPVLESVGRLEGVSVTRRELQTEDVTEQVVDVEARIANQRASVERVRGLLDRATTTAEITDIEAELTERQSELESLQRRYETLKGQVALSTLTVVITTSDAPAVVAEEENGFLAAFTGGWKALLGAFGWLLVVVGAVLPFAVVLGLPAFGYLWWRRRRRAGTTLLRGES